MFFFYHVKLSYLFFWFKHVNLHVLELRLQNFTFFKPRATRKILKWRRNGTAKNAKVLKKNEKNRIRLQQNRSGTCFGGVSTMFILRVLLNTLHCVFFASQNTSVPIGPDRPRWDLSWSRLITISHADPNWPRSTRHTHTNSSTHVLLHTYNKWHQICSTFSARLVC